MPVARLPGWLVRFATAHGRPRLTADGGGGVLLAAPDGTAAAWGATGLDLAAGRPPGAVLEAAEVLSRTAVPRRALVLLLRRGGAVAGVVAVDEGGARVLDARVRTARVQSRTAAGGWSQQRYARRRAGQAAGLVRDAAQSATSVWGPDAATADLLATGGDRELCASALGLLPPPLAAVAALPRQELFLRADPRRRVLDTLADEVGAVHVRVTDAVAP